MHAVFGFHINSIQVKAFLPREGHQLVVTLCYLVRTETNFSPYCFGFFFLVNKSESFVIEEHITEIPDLMLFKIFLLFFSTGISFLLFLKFYNHH